jgi:hypothetical protein
VCGMSYVLLRSVECQARETQPACGERRGEYAPDKIRSLGTAGAMASGVRCVGGGGEKRAVETTGQKMAFGAAHYSGRDCLRRAAPGGIID